MNCDRCHQPLDQGEHGVWICPHLSVKEAAAVAQVTWPGGKTFENLGPEPVTFYSKSEYQRYLKAHNLEEFVRHVPVPGSDTSPHTTSWSAVSQHTLDGAKAMLERIGKASKPEAPLTYITHMTVTVMDVPGYVTTPIAGIHDAP